MAVSGPLPVFQDLLLLVHPNDAVGKVDDGLWPQQQSLAFSTISRCLSPVPMLQGPRAYIQPLQQGAVLSHLANVASPRLDQVDRRPVAW